MFKKIHFILKPALKIGTKYVCLLFPTQRNAGTHSVHGTVLLLLLLLLLLSRFSHIRLCVTPETAAHQAPRPWDSPGKNTGVGCHFLLQFSFKIGGSYSSVHTGKVISDSL